MILRATIAACALLLAGCAAPHIRTPDLAQTTIAEPGAGQLVVTDNRGVTITGWRRHLVDVSWQRYCTLYSDYACDPKARYDIQIGLDSQRQCWSQVYGVIVPKDPASGKKPVGLLANFECLGPGFHLWTKSAFGYRPDEPPPILAYYDCPGGVVVGWPVGCAHHELTTVPLAITVFHAPPAH